MKERNKFSFASVKEPLSIWFADKPKTPAAKGIYWFIVGLILYSGVDFMIHLLEPKFYETHLHVFLLIDKVVLGIFTLEFLIRLWVNKNKKKFALNVYNIFDFIVLVSFYFSAFNVTILRTFRLIRVIRMFRLLRLHKLIVASNIVKENMIKNVLIVFVIIFIADPLHHFILSIAKDVLGDLLFAFSTLTLAAMFGAFSYSYKDINPSKPIERLFAHLTTGMLMIPIGAMFLFIQFILSLEIGFSSPVLNISIWFIYTSIVLWDFANALRAGNSN